MALHLSQGCAHDGIWILGHLQAVLSSLRWVFVARVLQYCKQEIFILCHMSLSIIQPTRSSQLPWEQMREGGRAEGREGGTEGGRASPRGDQSLCKLTSERTSSPFCHILSFRGESVVPDSHQEGEYVTPNDVYQRWQSWETLKGCPPYFGGT